MNQLEMFAPPAPTPAKPADAKRMEKAAQAIVATGKLNTREIIALSIVRRFQGLETHEIQEIADRQWGECEVAEALEGLGRQGVLVQRRDQWFFEVAA